MPIASARAKVTEKYGRYFDQLINRNNSVLVTYEEFTVGGRERLLKQLCGVAHRRRLKGRGEFSLGKEATGIRIWKVN